MQQKSHMMEMETTRLHKKDDNTTKTDAIKEDMRKNNTTGRLVVIDYYSGVSVSIKCQYCKRYLNILTVNRTFFIIHHSNFKCSLQEQK